MGPMHQYTVEPLLTDLFQKRTTFLERTQTKAPIDFSMLLM